MPRVTIKKKEYKVSDFSKWIVGKMYEQGLTQADLAKMIGITQPSFCNRLEKGLFSYSDMLILFKELKVSDSEILTLMKL